MKSEKMKNHNNPIAIIGAMDKEIEILKNAIKNREEHTFFGFTFYTGVLQGKEVVLLKSGIGKVNAAIGTTLVLEKFAPKCVINTGSAGGFDENLDVGDVVISTNVRYHDVDVTPFGYVPGQMAGMPESFVADELLREKAEKYLDKLEGIQTVSGEIASGDVFMADPARVDAVRKTFPQLKAVEMEAAAIAHTCYVANVPFIIFRSISDVPGKENNNQTFEEFVEVAGKHSAHMVQELVKHV